MFKYEFAFRVDDTTITHIEVVMKISSVKRATETAVKKLENKGYTVNELVWYKERAL